MPLGIRKKHEENKTSEVKKVWYNTIDGIIFEGACPLEEEIKRKYEAAEGKIPRAVIAEKVKEEWKFPKDVSYVSTAKVNYLQIEALNTEEVERILINNKEVIEKSCNAKISDKLKLEKYL
jgi:hypothetical protein